MWVSLIIFTKTFRNPHANLNLKTKILQKQCQQKHKIHTANLRTGKFQCYCPANGGYVWVCTLQETRIYYNYSHIADNLHIIWIMFGTHFVMIVCFVFFFCANNILFLFLKRQQQQLRHNITIETTYSHIRNPYIHTCVCVFVCRIRNPKRKQ